MGLYRRLTENNTSTQNKSLYKGYLQEGIFKKESPR